MGKVKNFTGQWIEKLLFRWLRQPYTSLIVELAGVAGRCPLGGNPLKSTLPGTCPLFFRCASRPGLSQTKICIGFRADPPGHPAVVHCHSTGQNGQQTLECGISLIVGRPVD